METQTQEQRPRRAERVPIYLDNCASLTIGEIARQQEIGGVGYVAATDTETNETVALFKIERITDGRGRFWQCDGKLTIADRAFENFEYPLMWKQSHLNRGGYWVIVGAGHYARKLYRTYRGWVTYQDYRNARGQYDCNDNYSGHSLYRRQTRKKSRREYTGRYGYFWHECDYSDIAADACNDRYRKWWYRGKATPYGKRMRKKFAKLRPDAYAKLHAYAVTHAEPRQLEESELYWIRYILWH